MNNQKIIDAYSGIATDARTDARIKAAMREANPRKKKVPVKRLAAAIACLVLLAGIWTGANIYRNGGSLRLIRVDYENHGGTIRFSRSNAGVLANDSIIGECRQLTPEETAALFPEKTPELALGYFMNDELAAAVGSDIPVGVMYCVEAKFDGAQVYVSADGLSPKDTFAYDENTLGKQNTVNGTDIYGAYFITRPNSRGEQTVIYSTVFEKDGLKIETELAGPLPDCAETAARISELTEYLTLNDFPDFGSFIFGGAEAE